MRSTGCRSRTAPLAALLLVLPGAAMAIETPKHEVERRVGDVELRRYAPYVVAATVVEGDPDAASNEGFRRLAGYIFGGNRGRTSIEMTAPVSRAAAPQKIEMTAPVSRTPVGKPGAWEVTFSMPSKWTLATLPVPDDARVSLREIPSKRVAVLRFSGFWSEENFRAQAAKLEAVLAKEGLAPRGPVTVARYDPPWTPWFLRTNEVMVEIE